MTAATQTPIAVPEHDSKHTRILRWRNGEQVGPWEMGAHPTNRCNLKCKICWERRAEKEIGMSIYDKATEVSDERYLQLVDEAAALGVRESPLSAGASPWCATTSSLPCASASSTTACRPTCTPTPRASGPTTSSGSSPPG